MLCFSQQIRNTKSLHRFGPGHPSPYKAQRGTRLQLGKHKIFLLKKLTMTTSVRVPAAGRMNFSLCHQTRPWGRSGDARPAPSRCDTRRSGLSGSRRDGDEPAAARPLPPRPGPAPSPPRLLPLTRSPRPGLSRHPSRPRFAQHRRWVAVPGTAPPAGGSPNGLPGAAPNPTPGSAALPHRAARNGGNPGAA